MEFIYIYIKHDILRYVAFLYSKRLILQKKKDNFPHVLLCTKILTLSVTQFLVEFLKLAEGGGHFYEQKTMHSALNLYIQKTMHCPLSFLYKKSRHFVSHFLSKKQCTFS